MSVQEIEAAIEQLPPDDLAVLAVWFAEHRAAAWDAQIERDLDAGRLDSLLDAAEAEYDAGHSRPL